MISKQPISNQKDILSVLAEEVQKENQRQKKLSILALTVNEDVVRNLDIDMRILECQVKVINDFIGKFDVTLGTLFSKTHDIIAQWKLEFDKLYLELLESYISFLSYKEEAYIEGQLVKVKDCQDYLIQLMYENLSIKLKKALIINGNTDENRNNNNNVDVYQDLFQLRQNLESQLQKKEVEFYCYFDAKVMINAEMNEREAALGKQFSHIVAYKSRLLYEEQLKDLALEEEKELSRLMTECEQRFSSRREKLEMLKQETYLQKVSNIALIEEASHAGFTEGVKLLIDENIIKNEKEGQKLFCYVHNNQQSDFLLWKDYLFQRAKHRLEMQYDQKLSQIITDLALEEERKLKQLIAENKQHFKTRKEDLKNRQQEIYLQELNAYKNKLTSIAHNHSKQIMSDPDKNNNINSNRNINNNESNIVTLMQQNRAVILRETKQKQGIEMSLTEMPRR